MIQMIVVILFAVLSFLMAVAGVKKLFGRIKDIKGYFIAGLLIAPFIWFIFICCLVFTGISNFTLLNYVTSIRIFALLIGAASTGGVLYTVYLSAKKVLKPDIILLFAWNISCFIFILWMVQVNIL